MTNDTINGSVIHIIREIHTADDREGRDRTGRPTLLRAVRERLPDVAVSEHQVRQAMDQVAASLADTTTSAPPAAPGQATDLQLPPVDGAPAGTELADPAPIATSPSPDQHQPATRGPRPWPLVLIGLAAAVAVWSGWVGLGEMAGFGPINLLPGIGNGFTVNSAVVLPISVEAYAAYALRVWLSTSRHSDRTIRFARRSTKISLVVGAGAQVAYHLMSAAGYTRAPWWVTMLVATVPVAVLGLASGLAKLVSVDRQGGDQQ